MLKRPAVLLVIIILFSPSAQSLGDEDVRCTDTYCDDAECSALPKNCNIKLNQGLFMLSPDFCNCCDYCLAELAKGDACTVGDNSNGKHQSLCGSGLMCKLNWNSKIDGTCQELKTPCAQEQQNYDKKLQEGWLGSMETRPNCDYDGNYGTYKCIPGQICYCLHQNGSRIFGEANYNTASNYMPCDCSRKYYDAVEILGRDLYPHEHFRCTSNGNYEQLQCINDECLCVNSDDGAPSYSDKDLVNFENITSEELPCYTGETPSEDYYKKCEKKFMEIYKEVQKLKESGYQMVYGYEYPKCDLDGTYKAVQENKTHKYCVDKEGHVLTALNKTDTESSLLDSMDCNCVRANLVATTAEKPQCLENGNYNPVQCRRGICRCVDNNGDQVCTSLTPECEELDELNVSQLPCSKA